MANSRTATVEGAGPAPEAAEPLRPVPTLGFRLTYNVTVGDVMNRRPVTVEPDASLWDAAVLMRTHNITGLPVVERPGRLIGVLSQKDIAAYLASEAGLPEPTSVLDLFTFPTRANASPSLEELRGTLEEAKVSEAMTQPPVFLRSDAPLELAMETMAERGVNRLPVVDGYKLVGIVTPHDLLKAALRAEIRHA